MHGLIIHQDKWRSHCKSDHGFKSSFPFSISFTTMPEIKNTATKPASQESQSNSAKMHQNAPFWISILKIFPGVTPPDPLFRLEGRGKNVGGIAPPPLQNPGSATGWYWRRLDAVNYIGADRSDFSHRQWITIRTRRAASRPAHSSQWHAGSLGSGHVTPGPVEPLVAYSAALGLLKLA